jgi:uncharacterized membrane protein YjgN (DUF898 family)
MLKSSVQRKLFSRGQVAVGIVVVIVTLFVYRQGVANVLHHPSVFGFLGLIAGLLLTLIPWLIIDSLIFESGIAKGWIDAAFRRVWHKRD